LLLIGNDKPCELKQGRLCDIAPTILAIMGLAQPEAMTGESLLVA
jgi:2,3-bisphosphoglycerate-independent phosphoglycerate mutase